MTTDGRRDADRDAEGESHRALTRTREYRFCMKCWLPTAPVFACTCAQSPIDPTYNGSTVDELLAVYPSLAQLAQRVARGQLNDDIGTPFDYRIRFWQWLVERGRCDDDMYAAAEPTTELSTETTAPTTEEQV